jgi:WD40 repeat protein
VDGNLEPTVLLEGHEFTVWSVIVTQDGRHVASGGQDATVRLWDIQTGKLVHTFIGHEGPVYGLVATSDGRRIFSVSDRDPAVRVWDVEGGTALNTLTPNSPHTIAIAITPDDCYVITGGDDGKDRVWDIGHSVMARIREQGAGVYSIAVSPDGTYLVSGSKRALGRDPTGILWLRDLDTGALLHTLHGHKGNVTRLVFTPESRFMISGGQDSDVHIWDVDSGMLLNTLSGHTSAILLLWVSHDGRYLVTGANDGTIRVWQMHGGVLLRTLDHTENVHSLAMSNDGRQLVAGTLEGEIYVWDFPLGSPWIDKIAPRTEEEKVELAAFRMMQLRKVIGRYETLPMNRLATLLRFSSVEELEDWLLELSDEFPHVRIDGANIVIRK